MKSYSQVGQDLWVVETLPNVTNGTFIDIGCNHPTELSNTYALEQLGWRGWLVDTDEYACNLCREQRESVVVQADGVTLDWRSLVKLPQVDYLSLDCDAASLAVLRAILVNHKIGFRVATVEHDAYRFGPEMRQSQRVLLISHGYKLARADVESQGMAFEDWWTNPKYV